MGRDLPGEPGANEEGELQVSGSERGRMSSATAETTLGIEKETFGLGVPSHGYPGSGAQMETGANAGLIIGVRILEPEGGERDPDPDAETHTVVFVGLLCVAGPWREGKGQQQHQSRSDGAWPRYKGHRILP